MNSTNAVQGVRTFPMTAAPSAQVIAVCNDSPASTRTTTAVGLATEAARAGLRALLIDLDPDGGATRWLGVRRRPWITRGRDVEAILRDIYPIGWARDLAVRSRWHHLLQIIPTSGRTVREGNDDTRLRLALTAVEDFDVVVIDCPPRGEDMRFRSAVAAATDVVMATSRHPQSLVGLKESTARLWNIRRAAAGSRMDPGSRRRLRGVVVGSPDRARSGADAPLTELQEGTWPDRMLEPAIPYLPGMDRIRRARRYFGGHGARGALLAEHFEQIATQLIKPAVPPHR